jgi:uncharacterized membrane protein
MWKFGIAVLIACLIASMAIAFVRLTTTPTQILGAGFHGFSPTKRAVDRLFAAPSPRNAGTRNSGRAPR